LGEKKGEGEGKKKPEKKKKDLQKAKHGKINGHQKRLS